jgi:hypothetical protein
MKKILLLISGLLLLNVLLNSGYSTPKNNEANANTSNYSASKEDKFLSAPKTAPILLPLPTQSRPSGSFPGLNVQPKSLPVKTDAASSPSNSEQTSSQQAANTGTCTPDSAGNCPTTTASPEPSPSCNLNDPNTPIEQYQQNGQITCQ